MATIVAKKVVKRKAGYMYFVDGQGNVGEAKMNRKGGKKGRKVCSSSKPTARKKTVKRVVKKTAKRKTVKRRSVSKRSSRKR
jgi:hypothetical protein